MVALNAKKYFLLMFLESKSFNHIAITADGRFGY